MGAGAPGTRPGEAGTRQPHQAKQAREQARQARDEALGHAQWLREEAAHLREDARQRFRSAWEQAAGEHEQGPGGSEAGPEDSHEGAGHHRGGWAGWGEWARWTDWQGHAGWPGQRDMAAFRDLERLAKEFATDLRKTAWDSGALGGNVVVTLRDILEDTLDRIRTEVFGQHEESAAATAASTTEETAEPPQNQRPRPTLTPMRRIRGRRPNRARSSSMIFAPGPPGVPGAVALSPCRAAGWLPRPPRLRGSFRAPGSPYQPRPHTPVGYLVGCSR